MSKEKLGYWLHPTENYGDAYTSWILPEGGSQLIARSVLRSAVKISESGENEPVNSRGILEDEETLAIENGDSNKQLQLPIEQNSKDLVKIFTTKSEVISKEEGKDVGLAISPKEILGYAFARDKDGTAKRATNTDVDTTTNPVI